MNMVVHYVANARLPTEKAHGLQIVENCEAFAAAGADVTLVVPRRRTTATMAAAGDVWSYYGVARAFAVRRLACLDLRGLGRWLERVAFLVQTASFALVLAWTVRRDTAGVYYSRDMFALLAIATVARRGALAYEVHQLSRSWIGVRLQKLCLRRVGTVVTVTDGLAADLSARGARHVIVARDGFRPGRFANTPDRDDARREAGLPIDAFIVGFTGQLQTLAMSKGVDAVVEAAALVPDIPLTLCVAGGPAHLVEALRRHWVARGLPPERFRAFGDVLPARVPALLAAFDVGVLTMPATEHFARHASPLKLFEYLAAGKAIVATSLPSVREVLRDGETALLVAPGDARDLAKAFARLHADPALRARLGAAAKRAAAEYAWDVRAARILAHVAA